MAAGEPTNVACTAVGTSHPGVLLVACCLPNCVAPLGLGCWDRRQPNDPCSNPRCPSLSPRPPLSHCRPGGSTGALHPHFPRLYRAGAQHRAALGRQLVVRALPHQPRGGRLLLQEGGQVGSLRGACCLKNILLPLGGCGRQVCDSGSMYVKGVRVAHTTPATRTLRVAGRMRCR